MKRYLKTLAITRVVWNSDSLALGINSETLEKREQEINRQGYFFNTISRPGDGKPGTLLGWPKWKLRIFMATHTLLIYGLKQFNFENFEKYYTRMYFLGSNFGATGLYI